MPYVNRGKTETVKERIVYVHLTFLGMVTRAIRDVGKEVTSKHYFLRVTSRKIELYKICVVEESMIKARKKSMNTATIERYAPTK